MWRIIFAALAAAGAACGQFSQLATTDDGSVLIFSSTLKLTSSSEVPYGKLFVIDSGGLRLYAEREKQSPAPGFDPFQMTNYYNLIGTDLSGDGTVRAIIGQRDCVTQGSSCFVGAIKIASDITGPLGPTQVIGQARLSRNGQFAFSFCDGTLASGQQLVDMSTGARTLVSGYVCPAARPVVSSTGVVVTPFENQVAITTLSGERRIDAAGQAVQAVIDDAGNSVVYEAESGGTSKLVRADLAGGAQRELVAAPGLALVGMSNDGGLVAYLAGGQLYTVRADGADARQLTHDSAGLKEATLAGNGTVAFAVTAAGRILRIDTATGAVTELVGRTVTVAPQAETPAAVAGSAFCITGSGFADTANYAAPPLPSALGGTQLLLDGRPVPLESVTPGQICFQVPWETTAGRHTLHVATTAGAQFESVPDLPFTVSPPYTSFLRQSTGDPVAAHADFHGLITPQDPAHPGEIIHFYMTGLGPVSPAVADGAPAPANPPARVTLPFSCWFTVYPEVRVAARVLYVGLAPPYAGYYQVSIELPPNLPVSDDRTWLYCQPGNDLSGDTAGVPAAAH